MSAHASPLDRPRPNVVLILVDDMGFSDLGVTGSEIQTPFIDGLARDGVVMSAMYNCGRCCPTRASLLTGLYPHKAGVGHMTAQLSLPAYQGHLRNDTATIAEVLRLNGYRTLMAGKWHVGGDFQPRDVDDWKIGDIDHPTPLQRGFERFYGTLYGAGSYFAPHHMMADDRRVVVETDDFYMTDAVTDQAIAMIGSAEAKKPFFLYLAFTAPHWPLQAPAEDIARYEGCYRQGWDQARAARHERLAASGLFRRPWALSPRDPKAAAWNDSPHQDWEAMRMAVYAAMVDRMDRCVGRLLDHLTLIGARDDTLVMFLSDNGGCAKSLDEDGFALGYPDRLPDGRPIVIGNRPGLRPGGRQTFMSYGRCWSNLSNVPFRLHKSWVHEGGISTPLIVSWPGRIAGGRAIDEPAHVIDLMPTILDAAGATMPGEIGGNALQALDGVSLLDPLAGGGQLAGRMLFWEHGGHRAARVGNLKLVRERGHPWELYDMDEDRTELSDLAPTHGADVSRLEAAYDDWATACGVEPWRVVKRRIGAGRDAT